MAKRKDFLNGPLYTIPNYIYWFILGNIYFSLCSIFFILTIAAFENKVFTDGILFFIISLALEGPAVSALFSVMGKLVREKDINITKDYFKAYKNNFLQSIILSTLQAILLFIILLDLRAVQFIKMGDIIKPVLFATLFISLFINIYAFPLITRFCMKLKDIIKLSIYYSVKKLKITILNISVLILDYILINFLSAFSIFFTTSIVCYIIMYYEKEILEEIENKIKSN